MVLPILPFQEDTIINYEKAIWNYNSHLFVIDSLEHLRSELARYFGTF